MGKQKAKMLAHARALIRHQSLGIRPRMDGRVASFVGVGFVFQPDENLEFIVRHGDAESEFDAKLAQLCFFQDGHTQDVAPARVRGTIAVSTKFISFMNEVLIGSQAGSDAFRPVTTSVPTGQSIPSGRVGIWKRGARLLKGCAFHDAHDDG